jgi:hypothetical protein
MDDYRLLQRHKVNNVWQEPGYELSLPPQLGEWLVSQGVAERVTTDPVTPIPRIADVVLRPPILAKAAPRFRCCGWK